MKIINLTDSDLQLNLDNTIYDINKGLISDEIKFNRANYNTILSIVVKSENKVKVVLSKEEYSSMMLMSNRLPRPSLILSENVEEVDSDYSPSEEEYLISDNEGNNYKVTVVSSVTEDIIESVEANSKAIEVEIADRKAADEEIKKLIPSLESYVTVEALNKVDEDLKLEIERSTKIDKEFDSKLNLKADESSLSTIVGNQVLLEAKLAIVEKQLNDLKITNPINLDYNSSLGEIDEPNSDIIVTGSSIDTVTEMTAKSIKIEDFNVENSRLNLNSISDVNISKLTYSGKLEKSVSNAAMSINTDSYISINQSDFNQDNYNAIEIGLTGTAPKGITIDNVKFRNKISNNAISIFAHAENAIINISNCEFDDVSNAIRLSNRLNVPAVINIINCKVNKWSDDKQYQGVVLLQDYTSKTVDVAKEQNLFNNITINFVNLIGPDGNKIKPNNIANVCPGGSEDQLLYVYTKEGIVAYDESRYPKINFN